MKISNDVLYLLYQSVEGSKTIWQQFEVKVQRPSRCAQAVLTVAGERAIVNEHKAGAREGWT